MKNATSYNFEWLYTQFVSDSIFINVILHQTDMFGYEHSSYMSVSYYTIDGKKGHERYLLSCSDSPFFLDGDILRVHLKKGFIEVDGAISFTCCCETIEQNLYENSIDCFSAWNVIIPHGIFQGRILYKNNIYAASAIVYQDKQFGELPIQQFLDKWGWGVIVKNDVTHGIFSVLTRDKKAVTIKFCCDGINLTKSVEKSFNESWVNSLCSGSITNQRAVDLFDVDVNYQNPIRSRICEKYDDFIMTYYRYACTQNSILCGACEYMEINKEDV